MSQRSRSLPPHDLEQARFKAKERQRELKKADYVKGLDESLQIKKARLREARKREVALDARVLQVDRQDLAKERTDQVGAEGGGRGVVGGVARRAPPSPSIRPCDRRWCGAKTWRIGG